MALFAQFKRPRDVEMVTTNARVLQAEFAAKTLCL
jgi:hypothetical protein